MNGRKKLSDFFIDNRLSVQEKGNTWVMCSGEAIMWIAGQRLDDRFKVDDTTRKVLIIELKGKK